MGTVNVGATPELKAFNQSMVTANSTIPTVTPVQPQTIPQSQNIATFGTQPINLPASNISQPTPQLNQADQILRQTAVADTEAQKASQNISKTMLELIPQLQGQTQELANQQQAFGVQNLKQNLLNLNNQIIQKQAEIQKDDITLANTLAQTEGGGILGSIVARQQLDTQRKAQLVRSLKMADIGILNAQALAAQGNISLAQDTAKQAVETKYAPYKELLETLKMQSEALQPILTADEKKQAREQDIRTNLALKEVDKAQKNEESILQMVIQAGTQGAPQTLVDKARQAKTPAEAVSILGAYAGDYWGTKIKMAQYSKLLKENAKIASEISSSGVGANSTVAANDQAKFLLDTITKAKKVADAAGRSAGRRTAESWLVGSTDYTNLETQVRTLKNNLLTLATDPNIKKFFGPQMTESDVKNMQSAATTLDPELQNPEDLKSELVRAEKIFKKFAPDYVPQAPDATTWASGLNKFLTTPTNNNYGYVDNQ